jgi:hypothetical protein
MKKGYIIDFNLSSTILFREVSKRHISSLYTKENKTGWIELLQCRELASVLRANKWASKLTAKHKRVVVSRRVLQNDALRTIFKPMKKKVTGTQR